MPVAAYAFAVSYLMPALILIAALEGSYWLLGVPIYAWIATTVFDRLFGAETRNADVMLPDSALFWHRAVTWAWLPTQIAMIFGALWAATAGGWLTTREGVFLLFGVGVASGGIGITYAHELVHSKNRWERLAGEILLASVCYGHFATEHVLNHHRYVGTPKDPVTARYGESVWRFLIRAVWGSAVSAWEIDAERQRRRGRPVLGRGNPWWRYVGMSASFALAAWAIGGWAGVGLFILQAVVAVTQLETVNYVEHYGLTRKHLGGGKYEHAKPRHSWNSSHSMTNLLLINLQRHSDHHYKPDRRYPLLQTYGEDEAPQLPYGYPMMVLMALIPPVWFRVMNRRVKDWRKRFYPEVTDWGPYKRGLTPMPR